MMTVSEQSRDFRDDSSTVAVLETDIISAFSLGQGSPNASLYLQDTKIKSSKGDYLMRLAICDSKNIEFFRDSTLEQEALSRLNSNGIHMKELTDPESTDDKLCLFFQAPKPPATQPKDAKDTVLESLQQELNTLYEQHPDLKDSKQVEGLMQERIKLLHRYNEAKDAGQVLLGRLAHLEGRTTKEMYEKFDLDLDE
jgi:hypothetical protein